MARGLAGGPRILARLRPCSRQPLPLTLQAHRELRIPGRCRQSVRFRRCSPLSETRGRLRPVVISHRPCRQPRRRETAYSAGKRFRIVASNRFPAPVLQDEFAMSSRAPRQFALRPKNSAKRAASSRGRNVRKLPSPPGGVVARLPANFAARRETQSAAANFPPIRKERPFPPLREVQTRKRIPNSRNPAQQTFPGAARPIPSAAAALFEPPAQSSAVSAHRIRAPIPPCPPAVRCARDAAPPAKTHQ